MGSILRHRFKICLAILCIAAVIFPIAGVQNVSAEDIEDNYEINLEELNFNKFIESDFNLFNDEDYEILFNTKETALIIRSAEELAAFRDAVNSGYDFEDKYVRLGNDIDLSGSLPIYHMDDINDNRVLSAISGEIDNIWVPIGNEEYKFKGTFDGDFHQIQNMVIYIKDAQVFPITEITSKFRFRLSDRYYSVGFFGSIDNNAVIKNLGIDSNSSITCLSSAANQISSVGGICGRAYGNASIINCFNDADIYNSTSGKIAGYTGGICGNGGTISRCYNTGSIYGYNNNSFASGIVPFDAYISNCYNAGDIYNYSGPINTIDTNISYIINDAAAGISITSGLVENCYNIGNVASKYNSQPITFNNENIINCYYKINCKITNTNKEVPFSGYNGIGISIDKMQGENAKTYMTGFSDAVFEDDDGTSLNVWVFIEDQYPQLLTNLWAIPIINLDRIIEKFDIPGQVGSSVIDNKKRTVSIVMPYGTNVTQLTPTIEVGNNATINPASGVEQDFTNPVKYTVIPKLILKSLLSTTNLNDINDANLDSLPIKFKRLKLGIDYIVTVTVQPAPPEPPMSSNKQITQFSIPNQVSSSINEQNHTISVIMQYGTNLTGLVPSIEISIYASINPAGGTAQNFTGPVTYTVTAQDGSTANYIVTVTVQSPPPSPGSPTLSSNKSIIEFSIPNQISSSINEQDHIITVVMPYGTDLTDLTPSIVISSYASINPANGIAGNFTDTVIYTVTAQNGSKMNYSVYVTVKEKDTPITRDPFGDINIPEPEIISFNINNQISSVIDGFDIIVVMPYGTDVTNLNPELTLSAGSIISPTGPQDFTNSVEYIVTGADGSIVNYTVIVIVEDNGDILNPPISPILDDGLNDGLDLASIIIISVGGALIVATAIYIVIRKRKLKVK